MAAFVKGEISLSFDLCGCPNRCRHCWLGQASCRPMDLQQALERFDRFRSFVAGHAGILGLNRVRFFSTYFREPHWCSDYRRLREIELELNAGVDYAADYQLLSVWRLANDPGYAEWAKSIGTRKCQIALFGLGETNDWFCRRKGAHRDIVAATVRLLDVGIQPRWQVFLTKRGLPELQGILDLADELRISERVAGMGGQFDMFLNDATPVGEAEQLQDLRLTPDDVERIPKRLIESSELYFSVPFSYRTGVEWMREIMEGSDAPIGLQYPGVLWLFVASDWSVYSNVGSLEPWWRLGNLETDGPGDILDAYANDKAPALRAGQSLGIHEAARRFGRLDDRRLYSSRTDFTQLWLEMHCRNEYEQGR
jgi:hypothetical protein